MRFSTANSPLLLLLLPSLAAGLSPRAISSINDVDAAVKGAGSGVDGSDKTGSFKKHGVPTRDAPVDGKDGKPHSGPFVETTDDDGLKHPPLKGRPDDPTLIDGKPIPKSNDGVMFDKNRDRPEKGTTTGTEGGVSEKEKARKAQEGKTGEKSFAQVESPKEQPALPHSAERKLKSSEDKSTEKGKQSSDKDDDNTDYTGLDVSSPPNVELLAFANFTA